MRSRSDPHLVLEIQPGADAEEIKQAWRDLVQVWHPDRFASNPRLQEKASRKIQQINQAYDELRMGRSSAPARPNAPAWSDPAPWSEYADDAADPERDRVPLDVLRDGVQHWNLWRNKYSSNEIDLAGADLRGESLSLVNLSEAVLRGARFQEADLYRANLAGAKCSGATFHAADMSRCTLSAADLSGADLIDADLSSATFHQAVLRRTRLHNANLGGCDLRAVDLRQALGLTAQQLRAAVTDRSTRLPAFSQ